MTHQAHNIPWQTLVQHLRPLFRDSDDTPAWLQNAAMPNGGGKDSKDNASNFYLCSKPNQGKDLDHFVEAFVRNIHDHTRSERRKYPETYKPLGADEIVLTDHLVRKLNPAARYVREHSLGGSSLAGSIGKGILTGVDSAPIGGPGEPPCQHDDEAKQAGCNCIIHFEYRKAGTFLYGHESNDCYKFLETNGKSFFNMEIAKLMVLYGELDPILSVCSQDYIDFESWHSVGQCYDTV